MRAELTRNTIAGVCSVSGRGYWSGVANTVTFVPASSGSGVRFFRDDLPGSPFAPATTQASCGQALRTQLASGVAKFEMIEHIMAAICGLQIDDVEVRCSASEMPGMDGSSQAFALALQSVGVLSQRCAPATQIPTFHITHRLRIGDESRWIEAVPTSADELQLAYRLDYGDDSPIGRCDCQLTVTPQTFLHELAPARTFITQEEAAYLQAQGLAAHVTTRDLLVFGDNGPIDNSLRFENECARHKALDLLGDLALSGLNLIGRIIAHKSGHQMNAEMARLLRETYENQNASANANAA